MFVSIGLFGQWQCSKRSGPTSSWINEYFEDPGNTVSSSQSFLRFADTGIWSKELQRFHTCHSQWLVSSKQQVSLTSAHLVQDPPTPLTRKEALCRNKEAAMATLFHALVPAESWRPRFTARWGVSLVGSSIYISILPVSVWRPSVRENRNSSTATPGPPGMYPTSPARISW